MAVTHLGAGVRKKVAPGICTPHVTGGHLAEPSPAANSEGRSGFYRRKKLGVHAVCKLITVTQVRVSDAADPRAQQSSQTARPVGSNPTSQQGRSQVTITHSSRGDKETRDPVGHNSPAESQTRMPDDGGKPPGQQEIQPISRQIQQFEAPA